MADVAPAGAFCPERMPRSSTAFGPILPFTCYMFFAVQLSLYGRWFIAQYFILLRACLRRWIPTGFEL
jgi:hypothetical protein